MRRIKEPHLKEIHPLKTYQAAFEGFERMATEIPPSGVNTLNLELEDGNVLKIGTRDLRPDAGTREFDMPNSGAGYSKDGRRSRDPVLRSTKSATTSARTIQNFLNKAYQLGYNVLEPGGAPGWPVQWEALFV